MKQPVLLCYNLSGEKMQKIRLAAMRLIKPDLFCKIRHSVHLLPISRWLSVAA